MAYLVGTDEAGYGPNLGPLVISASAWEVPDGMHPEAIREALADVVVETPAEARRSGGTCVAVADSKALYKPRGTRYHLEAGLLAMLETLSRHPRTWHQLWSALAEEAEDDLAQVPWYREYDRPLPTAADAAEIARLGERLTAVFRDSGVRLIDLRSTAIFPARFNRLVNRYDSKGALLSHATIDLAARLTEPLSGGPITVICDKHGGRSRYQDLLADHFDASFIEIRGEGPQRSVYRFGPPERRFEFRFQTKAESYLPPALASMASKYLREVAMDALNGFWGAEVPDLKPTAGYPQDAKRFLRDISAARSRLGVEKSILWRER